jgi:hypothetical protein
LLTNARIVPYQIRSFETPVLPISNSTVAEPSEVYFAAAELDRLWKRSAARISRPQTISGISLIERRQHVRGQVGEPAVDTGE